MPKSSVNIDTPLVIDLDGTLLKSDLLIETGVLFLTDWPFQVGKLCNWLLQGKLMLKKNLAETTNLDVSTLPYNKTVLDLITVERSKGRKIILATGSYKSLAFKIAEYLGLFDDVIASNHKQNVVGKRKCEILVEKYGKKGFDYLGNSNEDLMVWEQASKALGVNVSKATRRKSKLYCDLKELHAEKRSFGLLLLKAMRLHQWLKNILIFVPLFAAHAYNNNGLMFDAIIAWFAFGLCASSIYLFNDLVDIKNDRQHKTKRMRPFASGELSALIGIIYIPILLIMSFLISFYLLSFNFINILILYFLITLVYSLFLKKLIIFDVMTLALLYTLRLIAGAYAVNVSLSFWILAFSMFIFMSLAIVKRYAEIKMISRPESSEKIPGRGYFSTDLPVLLSLGVASGYTAVLVFALYVNDPATMDQFTQPKLIWLSCPILFVWISRVWMLTHRGLMLSDPVVFAAKDKLSLSMFLLLGILFWFAT